MTSESTRSKWTIPALVISCVMNLFLGGVITGIVTGWFLPQMMHMRPPHLSVDVANALMNRLVQGLAEKDRQIIQDAFARRQTALAEKLDTARLAKLKVQEALRAEPFDPSQFNAALQNLDSQMSALPHVFQNLMMEVAPRVSVESRRQLADRFSNIGPP